MIKLPAIAKSGFFAIRLSLIFSKYWTDWKVSIPSWLSPRGELSVSHNSKKVDYRSVGILHVPTFNVRVVVSLQPVMFSEALSVTITVISSVFDTLKSFKE